MYTHRLTELQEEKAEVVSAEREPLLRTLLVVLLSLVVLAVGLLLLSFLGLIALVMIAGPPN